MFHLQDRVVAGSLAILNLDELKEGAPCRELAGGADKNPGRGFLPPIGHPDVLAEHHDLGGQVKLWQGRGATRKGAAPVQLVQEGTLVRGKEKSFRRKCHYQRPSRREGPEASRLPVSPPPPRQGRCLLAVLPSRTRSKASEGH